MLTLILQFENRIHPLLPYQLALEDSAAEPGVCWSGPWGSMMGSMKIGHPRTSELPFHIVNAAFFLSLSTFYLSI